MYQMAILATHTNHNSAMIITITNNVWIDNPTNPLQQPHVTPILTIPPITLINLYQNIALPHIQQQQRPFNLYFSFARSKESGSGSSVTPGPECSKAQLNSWREQPSGGQQNHAHLHSNTLPHTTNTHLPPTTLFNTPPHLHHLPTTPTPIQIPYLKGSFGTK